MSASARKALLGTLLSLVIGTFFGWMYLQYFYSTHAPAIPDYQSGAVYNVILFHRKVFLTLLQQTLLDGLWIALFALFGTAYWLNRKWHCFNGR